jgi:hypothetical protein
MDVYKVIEDMSRRNSAGKAKRVTGIIQLYSFGVSAKLREASYALQQLAKLASSEAEVTSSTTSTDETELNDRFHFYTDAFFAFLYSSLDVLAQVINQTMQLGFKEQDVSFKRVEERLRTNHASTPIQKGVSAILNAQTFNNLDKYRNCSTHRRQIYIRTVTIRVSHTPGYSATGPIDSFKRILCDDPLMLTPKVTQDRELIEYCQRTLVWVESHVAKVAAQL